MRDWRKELDQIIMDEEYKHEGGVGLAELCDKLERFIKTLLEEVT